PAGGRPARVEAPMGVIEVSVVVLALGSTGLAGDRVALRASLRAGDSTRSVVELKAEGTFRPASLPGSPEPRPLALKVETRLEFVERVAAVERSGEPRVAVRRVLQAAATINGEVRPLSSALRPGLETLVARRG